VPQDEHAHEQDRPAGLNTRTPPGDGHAHFVARIEESPETVARCRASELAGISSRFPEVKITVGTDWKTWRAEHDGCIHETTATPDTSGMGELEAELWQCCGGPW
jgi:hypothetical protein